MVLDLVTEAGPELGSWLALQQAGGAGPGGTLVEKEQDGGRSSHLWDAVSQEEALSASFRGWTGASLGAMGPVTHMDTPR